MLIKIGIGAFIGVTLLFTYACCKAASDADEAMGINDWDNGKEN